MNGAYEGHPGEDGRQEAEGERAVDTDKCEPQRERRSCRASSASMQALKIRAGGSIDAVDHVERPFEVGVRHRLATNFRNLLPSRRKKNARKGARSRGREPGGRAEQRVRQVFLKVGGAEVRPLAAHLGVEIAIRWRNPNRDSSVVSVRSTSELRLPVADHGFLPLAACVRARAGSAPSPPPQPRALRPATMAAAVSRATPAASAAGRRGTARSRGQSRGGRGRRARAPGAATPSSRSCRRSSPPRPAAPNDRYDCPGIVLSLRIHNALFGGRVAVAQLPAELTCELQQDLRRDHRVGHRAGFRGRRAQARPARNRPPPVACSARGAFLRGARAHRTRRRSG